jgi:hypothetical protein
MKPNALIPFPRGGRTRALLALGVALASLGAAAPAGAGAAPAAPAPAAAPAAVPAATAAPATAAAPEATAAAATTETPKPKAKFREGRRPSSWSLMTALAMGSGTMAAYASLGAPFVTAGVAFGIAHRLNVGASIRSVYTLRNAPMLDLKLTLIGGDTCADAVGGGHTGGSWCVTEHALAVTISGGYMFGGTVARTTMLADGSERYRLEGLPTYVDDTNHLRLVPAILYSYYGAGIPGYVRAQVLIQKFTEATDPTGTPRNKLNFLPELVGGIEIGVGTRLHFFLEAGLGPYIDNNYPVAGNLLDTERHITLTGHLEAGLALYAY